MDPKKVKKIYTLLSKITNIFTSFYVLKNGYILTKDIEKPFLVQIDSEYIELFEELFGKFNIVGVYDIKILKKVLNGPKEKDDPKTFPKLEDQFYLLTLEREINEVKNLLTEMITNINQCETWESFLLSDDEEKNEVLIKSLFTDNNYINFKPKDTEDSPDIILTKSLIPLVTEKNYTSLYYASKKKGDNLYMIIFDLQFELFRLYMYHYYVPYSNE